MLKFEHQTRRPSEKWRGAEAEFLLASGSLCKANCPIRFSRRSVRADPAPSVFGQAYLAKRSRRILGPTYDLLTDFYYRHKCLRPKLFGQILTKESLGYSGFQIFFKTSPGLLQVFLGSMRGPDMLKNENRQIESDQLDALSWHPRRSSEQTSPTA